MEGPDRSTVRELARWLRFYRDIGFTEIYRPLPAAAATIETPAVAAAPQPAPEREQEHVPKKCTTDSPPSPPVVPPKAVDLFAAVEPRETLEKIRKDLGDCQRCKLAGGRKTIVFGSGNPKAEIVFVGEGPGADEDEQGLPFVGRAGQLLTDMIEKGMKIPRPDVYICNIVKCRPPGNRKPERDEIAACRQFVERQLQSVRPRAICAMGATAAETLLGVKQSMGSLRGSWYEFAGIPLIVTYHPAYLLRDPSRKADTWEDLKMLLALLGSRESAATRKP